VQHPCEQQGVQQKGSGTYPALAAGRGGIELCKQVRFPSRANLLQNS
jgi:hypothetical protein